MGERFGVVGAGLMGSGIAYLLASRTGGDVLLYDNEQAALDAAQARIRAEADWAGRHGTDAGDAAAAGQRVRPTDRLADMATVGTVIEAVFEDLGAKQEVFAQLDRAVEGDAILASNTSGLSITAIAAATRRPARVVGTHFFNPVRSMRLVELVRGAETADGTLEEAAALCGRLGKEVVRVADRPGFVVTRLGQALMCEAVRCLEEGVAGAEDIDRAMRLGYNHPLGPLELMDLIGLDTELRIQESLRSELGERFRPSPLLKTHVAAGHRGRKAGRGFHGYPSDGVGR